MARLEILNGSSIGWPAYTTNGYFSKLSNQRKNQWLSIQEDIQNSSLFSFIYTCMLGGEGGGGGGGRGDK